MKLDPHLLYCPLLLLIMAGLATWIPVAGQSGNVPLGDNEFKLRDVANAIGQSVSERFEQDTNFTALQQVYAAKVADIGTESINGTEVIATVAEEMAEYLQEIGEIVKNNSEFTAEQYLLNQHTGCCSTECIDLTGKYFRRDDCCRQCPEICVSNVSTTNNRSFVDPLGFYRAMVAQQDIENVGGEFATIDLQNNSDYGGLSVDVNNSALHYPLDIFDRDPRVLCFAQWSDNLTQLYMQHNQNVLSERGGAVMQYFGAATGVLRFYPAFDWSLLNQCHRCPVAQVDTYDSRLRPWYLHTIPGSKFLIIIMDLSGSMTGFRFLLAKIMAQQLLLTLSQNDFFIVYKVDESPKPEPLERCFNNKTRASPENILTMNEIIENLVDAKLEGRVMTFNPAIKEAVVVLQNEPECHNTIAVLSDQDSYIINLARTIMTINTDMIRVFVFLTGFRRPVLYTNRSALVEATCQSGGRLFEVELYSDILDDLREFLDSLRYLIPLNSSREEVFWTHYRDLSGGLSVSASQPLYLDDVDAEEGSWNRTFVGVSGVDVNTDTLLAAIFQHDLGPFGYGFVIDNNGQVVYHPLINYTYIQMLSGDDLIALDISNFEHPQNSSEFEEIRRSMLNLAPGSVGSQTIVSCIPVQGGEGFQLTNVTYYYAAVSGTPFRVAIVLPMDASVRTVPSPSGIELREDVKYSIDSERVFCDNSTVLPPLTSAREFLQVLVNTSVEELQMIGCGQGVLEQLLFDLNVSNSLIETYIMSAPKAKETSNEIVVQFVSGLSVCYSTSSKFLDCSAGSQFYLQDTLLQQERGSEVNVYYHTVADSGSHLAFQVLEQNSTSQESELDPASYSSILGSVQSRDLLNDILNNALSAFSVTADFYLLEGRGEIVASTDEEASGPFRHIHPEIFQELLNQSIYTKIKILGSEVRPCANIFMETTSCFDSSSLSMYKGVLVSLVNTIWWTANGGLWTTIQLTWLSLQASIQSLVMAQDAVEPDCPVMLCREVTTFYQLTNQLNYSSDEDIVVKCRVNETESVFQVASVPNTNLLLVEVRNNCSSQADDDTDHLMWVSCPCNCKANSTNCTADPVSRTELGDTCYTDSRNITQSCLKSSSVPSQRVTSHHNGILILLLATLLPSLTSALLLSWSPLAQV